jgi:hypothetical protein
MSVQTPFGSNPCVFIRFLPVWCKHYGMSQSTEHQRSENTTPYKHFFFFFRYSVTDLVKMFVGLV